MVRLFIQRLISKKNPLFGDREHIHHLILKKFKISISAIYKFERMYTTLLIEFNF